jgi:thiol:disulfide interchange protein
MVFSGAFCKRAVDHHIASRPLAAAPFSGVLWRYRCLQPAWVVMLIFFGVGLGMASPYLVISRLIPRH